MLVRADNPATRTCVSAAVRAWPRAAALAACLLASAAGCARMKLPSPGFRDDFARWGETQRRPTTVDGIHWGFSDEARQVERNLGVR